MALKKDGTVWTWGNNLYGQLGNGTNTNSNFPSMIQSKDKFIAISGGGNHALFLREDQVLFAAGYNKLFGTLGDSTTQNSNVLVQTKVLCKIETSTKEAQTIQTQISLYPNPSNGIFQLNINNLPQTNGEIAVYNVLGEKVYSTQTLSEQTEIDLSAFGKGLYFVKLACGTEVYNKKIIVE